MYRLYDAPGAASLLVHWLLIETGAPYELERVDIETRAHKRPEYLALNPNGDAAGRSPSRSATRAGA